MTFSEDDSSCPNVVELSHLPELSLSMNYTLRPYEKLRFGA